jgi:hypothetical protein
LIQPSFSLTRPDIAARRAQVLGVANLDRVLSELTKIALSKRSSTTVQALLRVSCNGVAGCTAAVDLPSEEMISPPDAVEHANTSKSYVHDGPSGSIMSLGGRCRDFIACLTQFIDVFLDSRID